MNLSLMRGVLGPAALASVERELTAVNFGVMLARRLAGDVGLEMAFHLADAHFARPHQWHVHHCLEALREVRDKVRSNSGAGRGLH